MPPVSDATSAAGEPFLGPLRTVGFPGLGWGHGLGGGARDGKWEVG